MLLFILVFLILYTQVFFSSTTLADKSNLLWSSAESALPTTAMPHLVPDITVAPPRHSASAQSSPSSAPIPATPSDASVQTSPPSSAAPIPAPPTSTDPPKPAPPSSSLDAIIDPDSGKYEYGRPLFTQDFPSPPPVDTSVMIFVMSSRDNFSARQLIRQTWAKGHSNVYFLLGAACPLTPAECAPYRCGRLTVAEINGGPLAPVPSYSTDDEVRKYQSEQVALDATLLDEANMYKDVLLFASFPDSYRSLTQKLKASYEWGILNTPAKFFVKADDDQYVRVRTLERYLTGTYNPDRYQYIGSIKRNTKAHRVGTNGHIFSGNIEIPAYKPSHYPPWASGAFGHVVTRPIALYVKEHADSLLNYSGEDVSLAIWIDGSPFRASVDYIDTKRFKTHGNCMEFADIIIGHRLPHEKIKNCYEKMDENDALVFTPR